VSPRLSLVLALALAPLVVVAWLGPAEAARCGTGLRGERADPVGRLAPARRGVAARTAVPGEGFSGRVYATQHFRVLWGDGFDRADPDWGDPDRDGVPTWVQVLAEAMEEALATQRALGFADPYGLDRYYLDVFVGNTGAQVQGRPVQLAENYYGYTAVNPEHRVAYFVLGDDFSAHARDELPLLRATAAHELFHAVQRAYYPWDDGAQIPLDRWRREGWWFEATATWMEEVCEPQVDDYVAFVRELLSAPERPLFAMDGRREYGAAIFPGYLWLRHGGAGVWRETFEGAGAMGLEPALEAALAASGVGLAEAVGRFWSLAGHPEDLWPDGARYRSGSSPALLLAGSGLPVSLETTDRTAPGRFGANLLRLRAGAGPLEVEWESSSPAGAVVGSSRAGSAAAAVAPAEEGTATIDGPFPSGDVFLALVNVSPDEGPLRYRTVLRDGGSPGAAGEPLAEAPGGGGSGGCFLRTLALP